MKISLKLLLLFLSFKSYAVCEFKSNVNSVVSLSGSSTVLLRELGLLSHKKVKGISVFNPVTEKEFTGRVYPGGIFFSQNALSELSGSLVFFDESRELKKIFSPLSSIEGREIRTRNLTPIQSVNETLRVVGEYLNGCQKEILQLKKKIQDLQDELLKNLPRETPIVFYLGEFRGDRAPEMVIVNDGVVKFLVEQKKIQTYPSELAYVNWSAKILNSMPKNTLHVGIKDSGRDSVREIKKSSRGMTLIYPGALVPGLTQLEAFVFWAKNH